MNKHDLVVLGEETIEEKFDKFKETIKRDTTTHRLTLAQELSEVEIEETFEEDLEVIEEDFEETEVDFEEETLIEETDRIEEISIETLTEMIE